jgi:hypothetical protein
VKHGHPPSPKVYVYQTHLVLAFQNHANELFLGGAIHLWNRKHGLPHALPPQGAA